jgi:putative phage-type endonuclease
MALVNKSYIIIEQNINDLSDNKNQFDDEKTDEIKKYRHTIKYLKSIPKFEQKSVNWLKQRSQYIGGSEAGTLVDANHYEPYYKLILKKVHEVPFINFAATYIGNKYENIANMIYEYLMNVRIDEYGFIPHKTIKFIGASPDGIVSKYKYDGIHKTSMVGKMLEIKCTVTRKINMDDDAEPLEIVPIYYYPQLQQQLETCDLDECDFWQIKPVEYNTRDEFKEDTSKKCHFKTIDEKFKGVVIQILPISKFKGISLNNPDKKLFNEIYKNAKFMYPPRIDMTQKELFKWINDVKHKNIPDDLDDEIINNNYKIRNGYAYHKAFYWKVDYGRCTNIKRDKEWFKKYYPKYEKTWEYITFLRENPQMCQIFIRYVDYIEKNKSDLTDSKNPANKIIIKALDKLCKYSLESTEVRELCDDCGLILNDDGFIDDKETECEFPGYCKYRKSNKK